MSGKICVTILDDHQSIVDGYLYRLSEIPSLEVTATLRFGEDLEPSLTRNPADVLLLDFGIPTSPDNPSNYPILTQIPKLLQLYPDLDILVISMFGERGLIRAVMEAGASGYILKDDAIAIQDLGNIIISITEGAIYLSQKAGQLYKKHPGSGDETTLTRRQLEALLLCATYPNSTTSELATKMTVSNSTARNLLSGAYMRLGVHTRAAAIEKARKLGWITPDTQSPPA